MRCDECGEILGLVQEPANTVTVGFFLCVRCAPKTLAFFPNAKITTLARHEKYEKIDKQTIDISTTPLLSSQTSS